MSVTEADTAIAFRSGNVAVLATPRVVALCEEAAVARPRRLLGRDETRSACGCRSTTSQPTAVGAKVTAEATLEKVEGRRLTFTVTAHDARGLVAAGRSPASSSTSSASSTRRQLRSHVAETGVGRCSRRLRRAAGRVRRVRSPGRSAR